MKRTHTSRFLSEMSMYRAINGLHNTQECMDFFHDLCTPAELEALADRWRVARMLDVGKPYRTIAEETGVSVTTVTRVARCMREGTGGYRTALKRVCTEDVGG